MTPETVSRHLTEPKAGAGGRSGEKQAHDYIRTSQEKTLACMLKYTQGYTNDRYKWRE